MHTASKKCSYNIYRYVNVYTRGIGESQQVLCNDVFFFLLIVEQMFREHHAAIYYFGYT